MVLPDDRAAVIVLTNQDAVGAAGDIAGAIVLMLLATDDPATPQKLEQARRIFEGLQHGTIDRSLFTDNANSYFSPEALRDFAGSLEPLGMPKEFIQVNQVLRGGMTMRSYRITFAEVTLGVVSYEMPDGKLEQYQIAPQN
jgi:hypothetical protein